MTHKRNAIVNTSRTSKGTPKKTVAGRRTYSASQLVNFFYGGSGAYTGADSNRVTRNWRYSTGVADAEMLGDLQTLRERSRDLYRNSAIGRGAVLTLATNVIGSGLHLQSVIDRKFLGTDERSADIWETNTERKFNNWASSVDCDASRNSDFFELEYLAYLSYLQSGEVFVLLPVLERRDHPQLCIQLVEADQISNAPGEYNSRNMRDGIKVNDYGEPLEYSMQIDWDVWKTVPARGELSDRPNVLHIYKQERPGQSRGVPLLAPVMENIKELSRYNKSELAAAVVASMFTVFIKSNNADAMTTPIDEALKTETNSTTADDLDYTLAPAAVYQLEDNQEIDLANPTRPNTAYEQFIIANLREIGMALQIPYEMLAKQFMASFSASKASRVEAWRYFMTDRNRFARRFCQPIYEQFLTDEVLEGRIPAPWYFDSYDYMKAWSGAKWIGESMGQIQEGQEVSAAAERVANGFTTFAEETSRMNGGDWKKNVEKLTSEVKLMNEYKRALAEGENNGTV